MPNRVALAALALCLSGGAGALTVDEILARHLEALGGAGNVAALRSLRMTGKAVFGGGDFKVEAEWAELTSRPGRSRTELTLQGLTAVDAFDGREAWRVAPFEGRFQAERKSADETKFAAQQADIEGPLVRSREKGHRVESLGSEDVDGTLAHKLRVTLKDGDVQYWFLDPDHFLEIRVVSVRRIRGVERITEADLGSYARVAGVFVPFSIEVGEKGRPKFARFMAERAEANAAADEALFAFPPQGTKVPRAVLRGPGDAPPLELPPAAPSAAPPIADSGAISGLGARCIGSAAMSGRVAALAARNEGGKTTIYVGAASGGVWKSIDGGTTFRPVFDKQPVQSIGAIAIDPSDPKIVWVGTGEAWTRNSTSIGDGIYRSADGGETWANMGLPASERIARIVIHPKKSDVVYACVPGKLWSDSADRGLYRTQDGGKSWSLVLKGQNLSTGCGGVTMDPKDPDILIASLWDFRRKGWTFRSGGEGPDAASGSGLFRTDDGGKSWTELSNGLPKKPWGRVDVAIAPSDRKVVYAVVESKDSALFRSGDGGKTWEPRDKSQSMVWRPFYFSRLVIDPHNPQRLFKPNLDLIVSEDGGKSFASSGGRAHGDWHDLWIDPDNTKHIIGGDDGGLWLSWDGGSRWWKTGNLPISQFYHVATDDQDPYHVYGGLQDNSSWIGDSQHPGGITNSRWDPIYYGDGFWTLVDLADPEGVYAEYQGGFISRIDRRTRAPRDIQPKAGYREKLRFNWNAPIHRSHAHKGTIYLGAQFLFRSSDQGHDWERISPDLTTNDAEKQKQEESGGVTVDNSSAEMHTTIYSISESPLDGETIWAGTDDGNLQLTRDGGKSWNNVVGNVAGLPPHSWVSWVEASRFDAATAYAAFDRHTYGDMEPHVFRTADHGQSWTRIVGPGSGVRGYAHVIREDTAEARLLFLGTEFGLWISLDGGTAWAQFKGGGFPNVAVRDLDIQARESDLVIGTHGRGIWIVDDIGPLRALAAGKVAGEAAFVPGRHVQQRMRGIGGWVEGDANFVGENPLADAVITYYQRTRHLFGPLKLEVLDAEGKVVETIPASRRRGLNRVPWAMQLPPPRVPRAAQVAFSATQGPRILPGTYKVRLTKGDRVIEGAFEVGLDRRAGYGIEERKEQLQASMRVHALFGEMSALVDRIEALRGGAGARAKGLPAGDELAGKLQALAARLEEVKKKIVATKEGGAITGEERIREHADYLYGAVVRWEGRPARYQVERIDVLGRELHDVRAELDSVVAEQVKPIDVELEKRKLAPLARAAAPKVPSFALECWRARGVCSLPAPSSAVRR